MAEPSELTRYVESYVNSSNSSEQQAANLEAIASLLKNNKLTVEALVREMGLYLTTTDNTIRSRGILLLAELLKHLSSKSMDKATIHSLIGFFTERLADWRALRGAVIGCLALLRRDDDVGGVADADAKAVAESYIHHLHVQSLGLHDRKLCFELLELLLECYPNAVIPLGEDIVYGIYGAIDSERDPECLKLTFHIVELLGLLFPDPSGPLDTYAMEFFGYLGSYFPILLTHSTGEDVELMRDDLSRALMLAFASTPLFEPFAVPLLLEKLSSSFPWAKVESLKYLSCCTLKYGTDGMAKHAEAIWTSLRHTIFSSGQEPCFSFDSESIDGWILSKDEVANEALNVLEKVVMQNGVLYINFIAHDEDVCLIFNNMASYGNFHDIPLQGKQKLHGIGCLLSVSAKACVDSCSLVFKNFFPRLMEYLLIPLSKSPQVNDTVDSGRLNFGALYLTTILLDACRDLIIGLEENACGSSYVQEACCCILHDHSAQLTQAFISTLASCSNAETPLADLHLNVKGLQTLATLPRISLPMEKSLFECSLAAFGSILMQNFNDISLWNMALKALVNIGLYIDRYSESEKALSYMVIIVEKITSLLTSADSSMPYGLRLEALSNIGMSGKNYMLCIIPQLEKTILRNLAELYVHGNANAAKNTVQLLEWYSNKVIPWIENTGGLEEVALQFVINLWDQLEVCEIFCSRIEEKEISDAAMTAMKVSVGYCSEESQKIIVEKAYCALPLSCYLSQDESPISVLSRVDGLEFSHKLENMSAKHKWIISLFSSVIIALRPRTELPNVRAILGLFMTMFCQGHVPSAQALGSVLNKLQSQDKSSNDCSLEEVTDIILNMKADQATGPLTRYLEVMPETKMDFLNGCPNFANSRPVQKNAIIGLAWIGKGLLMRGHEKIKEVTRILLEYLLFNDENLNHASLEDNGSDSPLSIMKCAADAFGIFMSDSEVCLSRRFHAIVRPLYKQHYFSTTTPILQTLIMKSDSLLKRTMLCRAFAHVLCETPLVAISNEAKKLMPLLLDTLLLFSKDNRDRDMMYSLLLLLSGILTDVNAQVVVIENAHVIINCLTRVLQYPPKMLVRETAIQCLVAMSGLPHSRIYPLRRQVLQSISKALDDPKRAVRSEAVRCRLAWVSIA